MAAADVLFWRTFVKSIALTEPDEKTKAWISRAKKVQLLSAAMWSESMAMPAKGCPCQQELQGTTNS